MRKQELRPKRDTVPPTPASRRLDLGRLATTIGFHVRLTAVAIFRDFVEATASLDITPMQFNVLELVHANGGASQVDVAAAMTTDRATMMAVVDRLEKAALLRRAPSQTDRRRQELHLTEAGQAVLEKMHRLLVAHEERMLAPLSVAERVRLFKSLEKIQKARGSAPLLDKRGPR